MDTTKTNPDGQARVDYFEASRFVGSRRVYCCGATEAGERFSAYWPHTAYFCPQCGELWGRAIYTFEFAYVPRVSGSWVVEQRRCVQHGDGQFLYAQSLELADRDLLTRELLALIEGALNGNFNLSAAE